MNNNITVADIRNFRSFLEKKEKTAPSKWGQLYYGNMIVDIDNVLNQTQIFKQNNRF